MSAIYENIRRRILALDPDIIEIEKKNKKVFNKNNKMFNFVSLRFKKDNMLVRIIIQKGELIDPKQITVDKTKHDDRDRRQIFFQINSVEEVDYAMEIIKQAYKFNEKHISKKRELKPRHHKRYEFWDQLLTKAKEKKTNFQNLSPTHYHWIGKGGGKSGLSFNFVVLHNYAMVEVYLDIGKKDKNKERYDKLFKHREEIHKIFRDELIWERLDNKRACRISYRFQNVGLKYPETWNELQDKMIEKVIGLENSFRNFIAQLD